MPPAGRRRPALVAATGLLGAALLVAGCGGSPRTTNGADNTGYITGSGGGGLLKTPLAAPDLTGTTLTGSHLSLASYRGKVTVVNFYASWCSPCRAETPTFVSAAKTYAGTVSFVGVLFKDSAVNGRSYGTTFGVTYPSLIDDDGIDLTKFKGANPSAVPDTFVLDKQGRVAARWVGAVQNPAQFDAVLAKLTAASPA